jgi:hypothetical protein
LTALGTDQSEDGLQLVAPDVGINGLIYALPKSGDHIILFSLDLKNHMPKAPKGKGGAERGGGVTAAPKQGFTSTSECAMIGDLKFPMISDIQNGNDKIVSLQSIKG